MSQDDTLRVLARAHGVYTEFHDLHGHQHTASPDTLRALLRALGVAVDSMAEISDALHQVATGQAAATVAAEVIAVAGTETGVPVSTLCDWSVVAESGVVCAEGRAVDTIKLPALDVGFYELHVTGPNGVETARLLVRPPRAPQPWDARSWGMTCPLYALRSASNGGLGNYADLAAAAQAMGAHGAQFLGINPIHALGWGMDRIISPYSPSHRGFFNIDHIATDTALGPTPPDDLVDYATFRTRHRAMLEAEFAALEPSSGADAFASWVKAASPDLWDFAQFEAISETYGNDPRTWPAALQSPGAAAKSAAGARATFHAWLQWRAETQLEQAQRIAKSAGMSMGLYLDLAVGPRPDGAEVWMNSQTIARGVTVGAPPDHLNPEGQSWALSAHAPPRLAALGYAPLRRMLQKLMARCGLLRIDHALGLLRSYWLPDDGSAGGYITQPLDALLAVIAIEAHQGGCVVVGEDLGLVPDGFRHRMNAAGLLSYAVWQYETRDDGRLIPISDLPTRALACFSTHDTPTVSGFWHGTDVNWWYRMGWLDDAERRARLSARSRQRQSLRSLCSIPANAPLPHIAAAIQTGMATAPSVLVSAQLDDAFLLHQAQNLPGTVDEHPNWRHRLPVAVDGFSVSDMLRDTAKALRDGRGTASATPEKTEVKDRFHENSCP